MTTCKPANYDIRKVCAWKGNNNLRQTFLAGNSGPGCENFQNLLCCETLLIYRVLKFLCNLCRETGVVQITFKGFRGSLFRKAKCSYVVKKIMQNGVSFDTVFSPFQRNTDSF